MTDIRNPQHVGDGVYISDDGYQIWLSANHHENRVIAIDPYIFEQFMEAMRERHASMYGNPKGEQG